MYSTLVLRNKDKNGKSTLYVQYAYSASEIKRIPTGVKVVEKYFDKAGQKIKKGGTPDTDADNKTIHSIKANVDSIIRKHLENKGVAPTVKQLVQEYDKLNDNQTEKYFTDHVNEFIELKKSTVTANTIKGYSNLRDNIIEYEEQKKVKLDFEDINTISFFTEYTNFLVNKGYYNSTISKRLGVFKTILTHFYNAGISKSINFKLFKFSNTTARNQEIITLDTKELELLKELDLSENKRLEKVRDLFILECWTGLRYIDLMSISKEDFKTGYISKLIEKTNEYLKIPLFPEAKTIVEKYEYQPPKISNDKYNEYIKEVCELVPELHEQITKTHFNGVKKITETKRKCDWISSHTARRTFATLLIELGAPLEQVSQWTGHKDIRTLMIYVNKKQGEQAEIKRLTQAYNDKVKALQ